MSNVETCVILTTYEAQITDDKIMIFCIPLARCLFDPVERFTLLAHLISVIRGTKTLGNRHEYIFFDVSVEKSSHTIHLFQFKVIMGNNRDNGSDSSDSYYGCKRFVVVNAVDLATTNSN